MPITEAWLIANGFAVPDRAALAGHYRKPLGHGLRVDVYLTAADVKVVLRRPGAWCEYRGVQTTDDLYSLVNVLTPPGEPNGGG